MLSHGASVPRAVTLTLLTRAYCHLCDDMREQLAQAIAGHDVDIVEIDIDAHPDIEARYGELVPVLLDGTSAQGREICHYHLDPIALGLAIGHALR